MMHVCQSVAKASSVWRMEHLDLPLFTCFLLTNSQLPISISPFANSHWYIIAQIFSLRLPEQ